MSSAIENRLNSLNDELSNYKRSKTEIDRLAIKERLDKSYTLYKESLISTLKSIDINDLSTIKKLFK